MDTVFEKVFVSFSEFAFYPETPFSNRGTTKHQSPTTTFVNSDGMLVLCGEGSRCPSAHPNFTLRIDISIAAPENEGSVGPWMVVEMPLVV